MAKLKKRDIWLVAIKQIDDTNRVKTEQQYKLKDFVLQSRISSSMTLPVDTWQLTIKALYKL